MSVAVVTGAASGMGRACADRFVAEGWQVAALDLVEADVGLPVAVDVTDAAAVAEAIARVVAELGPPKAVVNAAGIYPPSTLQTATAELYRRTFDVNVLGTLLVTQAAAPHLVDGAAMRQLRVDRRLRAVTRPAPSCASKAAVVALTRSLALELGPRVRVNALAPGWVDTPGNRATGRMEAALASVPLGRAATPGGDGRPRLVPRRRGRAGYVTGETLTATGGSAFR